MKTNNQQLTTKKTTNTRRNRANNSNKNLLNSIYNTVTRSRRYRIPTNIIKGGITSSNLETAGLRLDCLTTISLGFDGEGENATLSIGGNPLGLGVLGQFTIDRMIPDTLKDKMIDEFMTKGIGYTEFYIKDIIIDFRASRQTIVNISAPLYYKMDTISHTIDDLVSINPIFINQNQSKRLIYKYPKLDSQTTIGQQTRYVWVPVGIDEFWAEMNKTYFSCYCYAFAMNPFFATAAPLWNLQISVDVVFKKRQIENLQNLATRLNNILANKSNQ